jgi:hypothetical protein
LEERLRKRRIGFLGPPSENFTGAATPDVLEAVVKGDPDWAALPADFGVFAAAIGADVGQRSQAEVASHR